MSFQPRFAWMLALGCVAWQLVARVGQMLDNMVYLSTLAAFPAVLGTLAIAGLVAAQALITVGRGPQPMLLASMAVLVFAPAPLVGAACPMVCGLLGAAILLTIRGPLSWGLFTVACLADGLVGWSLSDQGFVIFTGRLYVTTSVAVTLFAVTRLARLIQEADDTRVEAARAEADAERLRSARRLRTTLGSQLAGLIQRTREASAAAAPSRVDVANLARIARQAAGDARRTVDDQIQLHTPGMVPVRAAPTNDYLLAWLASILIVVLFAGIAVNNVIWEGGASAGVWVGVIITVTLSGLLHLYHGTPRTEGQPRWWPWTLSAHAILLVVATAAIGESLFLLLILVAGTAVTRARPPWSWILLVLVAGTYLGLTFLTMALWSIWTSVYFAGALANGVIAVYALCNLPGVARRLHETRNELARTAVVAERLRFSRDVHDLLGFHLSAIAVKLELAARMVTSNPSAARAQLDDVEHSAERAIAEVRSINAAAGEVTTAEELASAGSILEAAGIGVTVDSQATRFGEVDHLVGIIVREAATNIIRHARAESCTVSITTRAGVVQLSITNDGAATSSEPLTSAAGTGTGIANLTGRVLAIGGRLTTTRARDTFTLSAQLPLQPTPQPDSLSPAPASRTR